MYNKEAFRKELEDCWDACEEYNKWYFSSPRLLIAKPPTKEEYITETINKMENELHPLFKGILEQAANPTRLAALDDGDQKKGQCNDPAIYYKDDVVDDGQEGRGLDRVETMEETALFWQQQCIKSDKENKEKYTQKEVIDLLKHIREYDDFYNLVDEDLLEIFVPSYTERVLNRPTLPVADGEGEKVDWKERALVAEERFEMFIDLIKEVEENKKAPQIRSTVGQLIDYLKNGTALPSAVTGGVKDVWAAMYNPMTYESASAVLSLHFSEEYAKKSMEFHKEEKRKEWQLIVDSDEDKGTEIGYDKTCPFGQFQDWWVTKMEINNH